MAAPIANGRVRQHVQLSWFDLANDFTSLFGLSSSGTRRVTGRSQTDVTIRGDTMLSVGLDVQQERADNNFITAVLDNSGKILESHTYDASGKGLTSSRAGGVDAVVTN